MLYMIRQDTKTKSRSGAVVKHQRVLYMLLKLNNNFFWKVHAMAHGLHGY